MQIYSIRYIFNDIIALHSLYIPYIINYFIKSFSVFVSAMPEGYIF